MIREKINKLNILLREEIVKAQKVADEVENAANEIARASYNSPSQSGDRFHSQGQADMVKERVERLELVLEKLDKELKNEAPERVSPVCFVNIEYQDGTKDEFYIVDEPLSISNYKFVSSNSPFGTVLLGKRIGDSFEFSSADIKKSGRIISIE